MQSRLIKFRAWDKVDYMSNPFTLQDIQDKKIQFTSDCPVMQFTGLYDKNGKEIYESDLVIIAGDLRVIEWYVIGLRAKSIKHDYNFPVHYPFVKGEKTDWEIIGNVHQNPELLR